MELKTFLLPLYYLLITVFSRKGYREGKGRYSGVLVNVLDTLMGNMDTCFI